MMEEQLRSYIIGIKKDNYLNNLNDGGEIYYVCNSPRRIQDFELLCVKNPAASLSLFRNFSPSLSPEIYMRYFLFFF